MNLNEIKFKLKERIALGLNFGLQAIEEVLNPTSVLQNDFIAFKSQYNDLNRIASQNLIQYEQIEIGFNKIRSGLLGIIDRLENKDLSGKEELPSLKNTELQFRKNNFFQLLDIHFSNLENIKIQFVDERNKTSRAAVRVILDTLFYSFKQPYGNYQQFKNDPIELSRYFFSTQYPELEVYMNTLKFILKYVQEEEMEQDFFLGVTKSILSTAELVVIFYYGISGKDDELLAQLRSSKLIDISLQEKLLKPSDFSFFQK